MTTPTATTIKTTSVARVLKITSPYGSLLLPADIEHQTEAELLNRASGNLQADLQANILVAAHHGSKSSSPAFIAAVDPKTTIFTVGYRNRFGHPKAEVLQRYNEIHSQLYRSDREGAILMDFGAPGISVTPWRMLHRQYWQSLPTSLAETEDAS